METIKWLIYLKQRIGVLVANAKCYQRRESAFVVKHKQSGKQNESELHCPPVPYTHRPL